MKTKGEATRAFMTTVNDPKSHLNKYPADFTLFEIGTYDETKGLVTPHKTNINVGVAVEFLTTSEKPALVKAENC